MKKKNIIILLVVVSLALLVVLVGISYKNMKEEKKIVLEISKSYNKYVKLNKDSKIYNKNKKEVGKISKGYEIELEKTKIRSSSDAYFKISNTNYYVYYKDVEKVKEISKNEISNNYIPFNKNITTKDKTKFYNNDLVLTINDKINLPLLYFDNDYYYAEYIGQIVALKKDEASLVDNQNTEEKESEHISIINFSNIKDQNTCNNTGCLEPDKIKEYISVIKENNYYPISIGDYEKWSNGNVRLKENAVLLTTNSESDTLNSLNSELGANIQVITNAVNFKFVNTNQTTLRETSMDALPRYNVRTATTSEDIKKMLLGEEIKNPITAQQTNQRIPVLNYHFFYEGDEYCNESICLEINKFREQLNYLRDNGFKTLTMEEFRAWIYGEIDLPEKSVLITIDDGAKGTGAHNGNRLIPLLEEYNMNATLFLISGWWDISNYQSPNLTVQSHTFDMHQYGSCGRGQLICASKEEAIADLRKSLEIVKDDTSFCFPFYNYSDTAIEAVKEVGFKLAFIGGNRKASRSDDKYKIPRYPIYDSTTLSQFINIVN